jgi:hypothetical protein
MSDLYRDSANAIEETWRTRASGIHLTDFSAAPIHQSFAGRKIRTPDPRPPINQPLGRLFERYARDEKLIAAMKRYERRQRAFKIIRQALITIAFIAGVIAIGYFIAR